LVVKSQSLTLELPSKLFSLSLIEESRISSVEVKFVDIRKNTNCEGSFLDHY
jgi:hypothetical protein